MNTENLAEERLENSFVLSGKLPITSIEACNSYVNRILKHLASQYQRSKATHVKIPAAKHLLHTKIWNSTEEKINYYRKEVNGSCNAYFFIIMKIDNKNKVSGQPSDDEEQTESLRRNRWRI